MGVIKINTVVVLQARTNSSRLPAKNFLPIEGVPLVVLAAKRAANTGKKVIVATSHARSDDGLVNMVEKHGLECFRGSLRNTLARFVSALDDEYEDSTIVIRLTADNVFPDGSLLDEIEHEFIEKKLEYICCNGEQSGLPYGVSVEATYLRNLREANTSTESTFDKEHVTPYIICKYGAHYFDKYKSLRKGMHRCTIDHLDDYLRIQRVFSGVDDPVSISVFKLVERLCMLEDAPITTYPVSQLVVGSAQLGFKYGITNTVGKPSSRESSRLLKTAINNGVEYIDTAHAYGKSEAIIGRSLVQGWESRVKVITKLSPLDDCPNNVNKRTSHAFVEASVYQSCALLGSHSLDILMLHRAEQLDKWNGYIWEKLISLQKQEVIDKLGVSVQSPTELERAIREPLIEFIQMPFNILDGRWQSMIDKINEVKAERKLIIHVRSTLLQGLLVSDEPGHWEKANVNDPQLIIEWLNDLVSKYKRYNVVDLCLAYVRAKTWVDGVVVGMEQLTQLLENIDYFTTPFLSLEASEYIESKRPILPEKVLNPSLWREGEPNG